MRMLDRSRSYGKITGHTEHRGVMVQYEQDHLQFDASGECIDDLFDVEEVKEVAVKYTVNTDMKVIRAAAKAVDIKTFGKTKQQIVDELNGLED